MRPRIAETTQEADRDIEHWTGQFTATLHQLKDEGILTTKDKIWNESRHYTTGYIIQTETEKESYLSGNQEEPPPENQRSATSATVTYKDGGFIKVTRLLLDSKDQG